MPLTLTERARGVAGNLRYAVYTVAFDSSYASGGEPLTAANMNMDSVHLVEADAPAGYHVAYDYTNALLRAYRIGVAASAIVAGANNTIVKDAAGTGVEVSGTGTAFQAALVEVAATADMSTDLSAVRLFVLGR